MKKLKLDMEEKKHKNVGFYYEGCNGQPFVDWNASIRFIDIKLLSSRAILCELLVFVYKFCKSKALFQEKYSYFFKSQYSDIKHAKKYTRPFFF